MKMSLYGIFLLAFSCATSNKTEPLMALDHWVVLASDNAMEHNNNLTWDFKLTHSGAYVVQVIREGVFDDDTTLVQVKVNDQKLSGTLKKSYVINTKKDPLTVSELNGVVNLEQQITHRLMITSSVPFSKIRIIPHYKNEVGTNQFYEEWLSMHNSPKKQAAMAWFKDAKYGMFIHWGLYSQAGGIWKGVRIDNSPYPSPPVAEWLMYAFQIPRSEYAKLANDFNPKKSFAQNIAKLAKDAGMKYVVITSKHHDGFALFNSKSSKFDIVDATPYKADAVKELYEACLKEGLGFGVYYSHGNDWQDGTDGNYVNIKKKHDTLGVYTNPLGKNLWDPSTNTHEAYLENKAYPQVAELLELMPQLRIIWFDGTGFITEEQAFQFYKRVYNINPNVIVNRRVGYNFGDYLDAGDNKIPSSKDKLTKYWETCGTTNNSWGYKSYDKDWKSPKELLYYFVDIISKGGNYLLNIGPDGKGDVPELSKESLREMGEWIQINADAIYGTSKWKIINEGEEETLLDGTSHRAKKGFSRKFTNKDFWFTSKENKVYAICLASVEGDILVKSLKKKNGIVSQVKLLGNDMLLDWEQDTQGLKLKLEEKPKNTLGFVLEITIKDNV